METLSVLFGGFYKYVKLRNLSALMGYKLTNPELTDLLTSLRKKGLVEVDGHYYVVEVELRLRLFLELMQDTHYVDLVFNTDVSDYSQPMRVTPELLLRNYLLEGLFPGRRLPLFCEWEDRSELADIPDLFFVMHYIIRQPGYDAMLAQDGAFLARVFQGAFSYGMVTMDGLPFLRRFCCLYCTGSRAICLRPRRRRSFREGM